ncbi:thiosulfate sulfurtransferase [bacterium]|nr:thiosulfate sulfurtransferase [bacterium]
MSSIQKINFKHITTEEIVNSRESSNYCIIDVRPVEAYNGWKLQVESRGGHIPGARSLPIKWFDYIDWIEIVREKGISPDQNIIIYGYDEAECVRAANQFASGGYRDIQVYDHFLTEWCENPEYPLNHLPRYKHLVNAAWLKSVLENGKADEFTNNRHVLCHAHYRNPDDYEKGHIQGAIALDTLLLESPETWNRRSPEELKSALEQLGITHDTTVTLYGRFSFPDNNDPFPGRSAGHLGAMRCAVILLYAGVEDIRILNGGLQSWLDEGFEITSEPTHPAPVDSFGVNIPAHPEYMVDLEDAKRILAHKDSNLVSIRSWAEYIGEVSGYNYIEKRGRIPGSVFGNCGTDAYHMENYRNLDHTTREFGEIEKLLTNVGVTPEKMNAFYCGTGWRGSEAFFNAWLMGWQNIALYDGGWFEWSNDESNPIETGDPNLATDKS